MVVMNDLCSYVYAQTFIADLPKNYFSTDHTQKTGVATTAFVKSHLKSSS